MTSINNKIEWKNKSNKNEQKKFFFLKAGGVKVVKIKRYE